MTRDAAFWSGRKVLVTGATGLLGRWLVPELLRRGADVGVLVREGGGRDALPHGVSLHRGALTGEGVAAHAMAAHGARTVFHLAAQTLVDAAKEDPVGTLETNVRGTWLVLEAARQRGAVQVIVASSNKAYGDALDSPYREDHALQGRYPYDVSKSCADLITAMYAQTYGLAAAIARCGNLYGGGDLNFSRLIPGVIRATLRGERFVMRSDGRSVRDFLYVEDAVEAYLRLAESLDADPRLGGEAFNFGLDARPTMLELARRVLALMGREDLEPLVQGLASPEVREQYVDATKARTRLGWMPRHGLDEGLRRTIHWYREALAEEAIHARPRARAIQASAGTLP